VTLLFGKLAGLRLHVPNPLHIFIFAAEAACFSRKTMSLYKQPILLGFHEVYSSMWRRT
jgi:hypothetical protein